MTEAFTVLGPRSDDHCRNSITHARAADRETNHRRQLFRLQLSAILILETGRRGRASRGLGTSAAFDLGFARGLSPHSVLPEALSLLLFPRLHGQRFRRDSRLHR